MPATEKSHGLTSLHGMKCKKSVHKVLIYVVAFVSGELPKIQEWCNFVDNIQAHIVFFIRDEKGFIMVCHIWG